MQCHVCFPINSRVTVLCLQQARGLLSTGSPLGFDRSIWWFRWICKKEVSSSSLITTLPHNLSLPAKKGKFCVSWIQSHIFKEIMSIAVIESSKISAACGINRCGQTEKIAECRVKDSASKTCKTEGIIKTV